MQFVIIHKMLISIFQQNYLTLHVDNNKVLLDQG